MNVNIHTREPDTGEFHVTLLRFLCMLTLLFCILQEGYNATLILETSVAWCSHSKVEFVQSVYRSTP